MPGEPLSDAIQYIKSGNKQAARDILVSILKNNPQMEKAWLWLVETATSEEERITILRSCLKYNPDSSLALRALHAINSRSIAPPSPQDSAQAPQPTPPNSADAQLMQIAALLGVKSTSPTRATLQTAPLPAHPKEFSFPDPEPREAAGQDAPPSQQAGQEEPALPPIEPLNTLEEPKRHLPRWIWILLALTLVTIVLAFVILSILMSNPGTKTDPLPSLAPTLSNPAMLPTLTYTPQNLLTNTPRMTWTPYSTPTFTPTPTFTHTSTATQNPTNTPTITPLTFNPLPANRQVININNLSKIRLLGNIGPGAVFASLSNWIAKTQANTVVVWNASDNVEINHFDFGASYATGLAISDDGKWLAISTNTVLIQVWNVPANQLTNSFSTGGANPIPPNSNAEMRFSRDGNYLAVSNLGVFSIWDMRSTQQPVAYFSAAPEDTLSPLLSPYFSLDFSPDNQKIAVSGYHTILIIDLVNRQKLVLNTPNIAQHQVKFSPDGQLLAASGAGLVKIINPSTGLEILQLDGALFTDQQSTPFAFVPGNAEILILNEGECCNQTLIERRRLSDGALLGISPPYDNPPSQLVYSPNGDLFLVVIPGNNEIILSSGDSRVSLKDFEFNAFTIDQTGILGIVDGSSVLYGVVP